MYSNEATKKFMMISKWKKTLDAHGLYESITAISVFKHANLIKFSVTLFTFV